jgi:hypothetical protein
MEKRNACDVLGRKTEHLDAGGRTMHLRDIELDVVDWINLAQERNQERAPVNMVMNLLVPDNIGKFLST